MGWLGDRPGASSLPALSVSGTMGLWVRGHAARGSRSLSTVSAVPVGGLRVLELSLEGNPEQMPQLRAMLAGLECLRFSTPSSICFGLLEDLPPMPHLTVLMVEAVPMMEEQDPSPSLGSEYWEPEGQDPAHPWASRSLGGMDCQHWKPEVASPLTSLLGGLLQLKELDLRNTLHKKHREDDMAHIAKLTRLTRLRMSFPCYLRKEWRCCSYALISKELQPLTAFRQLKKFVYAGWWDICSISRFKDSLLAERHMMGLSPTVFSDDYG